MVTDRASTACLWITLSLLYPSYAWVFQAMLALDIMSHFSRLVATSGKSHKDVSETNNIFLKYYYGNKYILFVLCGGHEGAFVLLYFLAMLPKIGVSTDSGVATAALYALYFSAPLCIIKEWMNAVQFWQSMVDIVEIDDAERKARLGPKTTVKSPSSRRSPQPTAHVDAASPSSPRRRKKATN